MALMRGAFIGRRDTGAHNAVSPDMLLEQTYNADAKKITVNIHKWYCDDFVAVYLTQIRNI